MHCLSTKKGSWDRILGANLAKSLLSRLRSTQAPPEGTTLGGAEDLDKLIALSSLVSTLVQKVNSQEYDLQAHKLLFKEVVGKLVKRVKLLEDKLKGRKRKVVLTDSDKEEYVELNVDPLIKLAQAAATAAAALVEPTDGFHEDEILPSSSIPTDDSACCLARKPIPASKWYYNLKSPSSPERDARKGKRFGGCLRGLQAQELADFEKQRAESLMKDANLARQMSQDFDMMKPKERETARGSLNVLVNTRKKRIAEQRALKKGGWTMAQVRRLTPEQLQEEFDKIQRAVAFTRVAAPSHSQDIPDAPVNAPSTTTSTAQHTGSSPKKTEDPETEHQNLPLVWLRSDSSFDEDTTRYLFCCCLTRRLLPMGLSVSMSSTETDNSPSASQNKQAEGVGLVLWGDLKVLIDSPEVNDETVDGLIIHMFVDKKYPLSINLIKRMLDHQLEICQDTVGNELTTAVQLIAFLKNQIADSRRLKVHDWGHQARTIEVDYPVADIKYMTVLLRRFQYVDVQTCGEDVRNIVIDKLNTTSRKLVANSVTAALEAQAATMENADNTKRNIGEREAHVARKCSYKEFMSCQPINFKGTEGAVRLICWFERTESVFSHSNCTEDCKVKFATSTLTKEALSWWNSFPQPIRIEEAYKITWVEFKKLLIKKYCARTEVQKMEEEFTI
ncbi:hypothetical protein Tco_1509816 [Tanacetum coccineum]